ncbi:MAG: hypothetical protein AB7O92_04250 [Acidimicrobiia bacterium]
MAADTGATSRGPARPDDPVDPNSSVSPLAVRVIGTTAVLTGCRDEPAMSIVTSVLKLPLYLYIDDSRPCAAVPSVQFKGALQRTVDPRVPASGGEVLPFAPSPGQIASALVLLAADDGPSADAALGAAAYVLAADAAANYQVRVYAAEMEQGCDEFGRAETLAAKLEEAGAGSFAVTAACAVDYAEVLPTLRARSIPTLVEVVEIGSPGFDEMPPDSSSTASSLLVPGSSTSA